MLLSSRKFLLSFLSLLPPAFCVTLSVASLLPASFLPDSLALTKPCLGVILGPFVGFFLHASGGGQGRGRALRISVSLLLGWVFGLLLGSIVTLVADALRSGQWTQSSSIAVAAAGAVPTLMGWSLRYEKLLGKFGASVASLLALGILLLPCIIDPRPARVLLGRNVLDYFVLGIWAVGAFLVAGLGLEMLWERAMPPSLDVEENVEETIRETCQFLEIVASALRKIALPRLSAREGEKWTELDARKDAAACLDSLSRNALETAFSLGFVKGPWHADRPFDVAGVVQHVFEVRRGANALHYSLRSFIRSSGGRQTAMKQFFAEEGIAIRAELYSAMVVVLEACKELLRGMKDMKGTCSSCNVHSLTTEVENAIIALRDSNRKVYSYVVNKVKGNILRVDDCTNNPVLSLSEIEDVSFVTLYVTYVESSTELLGSKTLRVSTRYAEAGGFLQRGATVFSILDLLFLALWFPIYFFVPIFHVLSASLDHLRRLVCGTRGSNSREGGDAGIEMVTTAGPRERYFEEYSYANSSRKEPVLNNITWYSHRYSLKMSQKRNTGIERSSPTKKSFQFRIGLWHVKRMQFGAQFAIVSFLSWLPTCFLTSRKWLDNNGTLGFWLYLTVILVSLGYIDATLNKCIFRIIGTGLGIILSIPWAIQDLCSEKITTAFSMLAVTFVSSVGIMFRGPPLAEYRYVFFQVAVTFTIFVLCQYSPALTSCRNEYLIPLRAISVVGGVVMALFIGATVFPMTSISTAKTFLGFSIRQAQKVLEEALQTYAAFHGADPHEEGEAKRRQRLHNLERDLFVAVKNSKYGATSLGKSKSSLGFFRRLVPGLSDADFDKLVQTQNAIVTLLQNLSKLLFVVERSSLLAKKRSNDTPLMYELYISNSNSAKELYKDYCEAVKSTLNIVSDRVQPKTWVFFRRLGTLISLKRSSSRVPLTVEEAREAFNSQIISIRNRFFAMPNQGPLEAVKVEDVISFFSLLKSLDRVTNATISLRETFFV